MSKSCNVTLVQASKCARTGTKITTLICEYPRAIHAQLLTHRVFSKNSSSTRAVPIKAAIQQVKDSPVYPIWTYNQSGMQGSVITDPNLLEQINRLVIMHKQSAYSLVELLGFPENEGGLNVHKQNVGRYLEPFQNIRIMLTSTEWENWDWLRADPDAQGEISELANEILRVREEAFYPEIYEGEYHVPFVERKFDVANKVSYFHPDTGKELTTEEAVALSMSMSAQLSYRKADTSAEKTELVNSRLFNGRKVHASPSEHQATPIPNFPDYGNNNYAWPEGITHVDREHNYWSGNFRNWIQNRQLIPNHDKAKSD